VLTVYLYYSCTRFVHRRFRFVHLLFDFTGWRTKFVTDQIPNNMNVLHLSPIYVLFWDIYRWLPLDLLNVLNYTAVCCRVSFEIIGCCCFSVSFPYALRYLFVVCEAWFNYLAVPAPIIVNHVAIHLNIKNLLLEIWYLITQLKKLRWAGSPRTMSEASWLSILSMSRSSEVWRSIHILAVAVNKEPDA